MLAFKEIKEEQTYPSHDFEGQPTVISVSLKAEIDLHRIEASKHQDLLEKMLSGVFREAFTKENFK